MRELSSKTLWTGFAMVLLSAVQAAGMTATLVPSLPSPVPVGTMITLNGSVANASKGTIWYRFRVRELGGSYQVIRDYSPLTSLDWTAADHEGIYEIELSAKNPETGESDTTSIVYQMLSQVTVHDAVVTPTAHPLVYLYSAV